MADDGSRPRAGDWPNLFERLESEIANGHFRFRALSRRQIRGRATFVTSNLNDIFVIRRINGKIRRAYRIGQLARFDAVKQLRQALGEGVPKTVIRLDVRRFFETIPTRSLLQTLRKDRLVSATTIQLLNQLLRRAHHLGASGIPRGLQISSTLAELHARNLESQLRRIAGVYLVVRYVDDIWLFSYKAKPLVMPQIHRSFENVRLRINRKKMQICSVGCRCSLTCAHAPNDCPCAERCRCPVLLDHEHLRTLDVLGYKLVFPDVNEGRQRPNSVGIYLGARTISKLSRRLFRTFIAYEETGNAELLIDRVRFLTQGIARLCRGRVESEAGFPTAISSTLRSLMRRYFQTIALSISTGYSAMAWATASLRFLLRPGGSVVRQCAFLSQEATGSGE